jgi:pSer/pThr/pTyr-binding forkhead associated (FHA) protein/outer membrane biosynthesis protein TonB
MDLQVDKNQKMYELRPLSHETRIRGGIFPKGRIILGRTESCDFYINYDAISAVHAVLEIYEDRAIIYDMNSTNGTYVNDDRVVVKEIHLGDTFRLADIAFEFMVFNPEEVLPPPLEASTPSSSVIATKRLPTVAPVVSDSRPSIVYPLAADPKAEFSEYIFEDKDELYPIFKYETTRQAVEVIILFKDQVFSVDYFPEGRSTYYIAGIFAGKDQIEFPYLGKNEKLPFVDLQGGRATVHTLPGFSIFHLSDRKKDTGHQNMTVELEGQDLVRLQKEELQIFVRNVQAPPTILPAPIIKRDPEFRKYLFLFILGFLGVTATLNILPTPEDDNKDELAPERIATILYKQPLTVNKNDSVAKTEKQKKIAQKAPAKPAVAKEKPKEITPKVSKPDVMDTNDQKNKPDPGQKSATEKKIVKKGTEPVTKPTDQLASTPAAKATNTKLASATGPSALSQVPSKAIGHVEVYKSADFSTSVNSIVAKGGSLSGIQTKSASGAGGELTGAASGVSTGTGSIKTAGIQTNQGSLVGAATGVLGNSKGAEGLSAKKAIYTAGIPSETVVLGSMDPDVIRRILLDHLPQFRYCYQKELERTGEEISGVIKLEFSIGASGHVTGAGVDSRSNLPAETKRCVVGVLKGIAFPEPMGGGVVEVKQPMNFFPKKI